MSADSSLQPQTNGAACHSKECPLPSRETIDWFTNSVWPALKQIADANLFDVCLLYDAAETLPAQEQSAWVDLIRRLEIMVGKAIGCGHPDQFVLRRLFQDVRHLLRWKDDRENGLLLQRVFRRLLDDLNANWFIPRSLLLYPNSAFQTSLGPLIHLWEVINPGLARIIMMMDFPFADGAVNVYIVHHLLPLWVPLVKRPCYFDPLARIVVIDDMRTNGTMHEIKLKARADDLIDEYLFLTDRCDQTAPKVERQFSQWLDNRYPHMGDLCTHYRRRVLAEELRHALDSARSGCDSESRDYDERLVEALLTRDGRVRRLLWEPAQGKDGEMLLCGQPLRLGGVVTELSAQMTAAAIGDPPLVLLEWWRKSALLASTPSDPWWNRFKLRQHPEHTLAGILGTILLGEQLSVGPVLSWSMLCEPDFTALANLTVRHLVNRPAAELRLALKAVYRNEFNYPIDELPFAEILDNGELRNRL